ncbi:SAM-dependent methyltransferase [Streptomyces sp. NEAU-Y11]|uniref:SAM-dependent methyltransferase n=1 Tax=Streptomyces cucumeris TaxID=2962890 RepID=UPI0020C84C7A|nr:SAM-dependent methyltransferase [Streptomyces sp. NEAU-Y11]MCP9213118.1 SAM-dependent methyltransferase [Streptomyces sp. NEAU-Y11]
MNSTDSLNGAHSPADVRTDVPHPARMYNYYLGGKDHYEIDQKAAEEVVRRVPEAIDSARANRAWMRRAVHHLAKLGVRQFLDVGTGLPTEPNLHQVAQSVIADAHILYFDNDPIVLTHAQTLLTSSKPGQVEYAHGDLREPQGIIEKARALDIFDWEQPTALVLSAITHFIPDKDDVAGIFGTLRDALPPGSFLVLSHATGDFQPERSALGAAVYDEFESSVGVTMRSREQVEALFAGFTLLEPGVVQVPLWHPDEKINSPELGRIWVYGGIGQKAADCGLQILAQPILAGMSSRRVETPVPLPSGVLKPDFPAQPEKRLWSLGIQVPRGVRPLHLNRPSGCSAS